MISLNILDWIAVNGLSVMLCIAVLAVIFKGE
jgi:hypothetical protein